MIASFSFRKIAIFFLILYSTLFSQIAGDLKVALIRISFPVNDYPGISGNGDFLYDSNIDQCGDYTIDPPPHDKNYFKSHLEAVNNYYRSVSNKKFGLDLNASKVFPEDDRSSYKVDQLMNYYNQIGMDNFHEKRITELLKDATSKAYEVDKINYDEFDLIIVVHPGVGQDFSLPFLDPTPEDIPSTYIDPEMVVRHLGGPITFENSSISKGVIIPETQNHLFYDYTLFSQLANPCDLQYSITGTLSMMIGFSINLPPLWNLDTGLSGVGVFALMDQGSNNGRGIIPAPPDAWSRIYAGWASTITPLNFNTIELKDSLHNQILKIPINNNEYFLIENRNNWFREGISIDSARYTVWDKSNIYPSFINILIDSVNITKNEFGVITSISNYNLGLPASGLLIWHIDENKINEGFNDYSINIDRQLRGIDLEEADGAQDMGYVSNLLTDPSSGYWGDMWFKENLEYFRANSNNSMDFSSFTYPNTKANSKANSGIHISNISNAGKTMSFNLASSYDIKVLNDTSKTILLQWDINNDGKLDFIGLGDSLWWSSSLNNFNTFYKSSNNNYQVCIVQGSTNNFNFLEIAFISQENNDSYFELFEFNVDSENFNIKWSYKLENINNLKLLKADIEGIWVKKGTSISLVNSEGVIKQKINPNLLSYTSSLSSPVILNNEKVIIDKSTIKDGNYKSISLIDLENDQIVEIVAVDKNGNIDAFDLNLFSKNGFPLSTNATSSVLSMNLFDDSKRELVYQNNNGEIIILNYEGKVVDIIATTDKLVSLGTYQGKNGILTNKSFFSFIDENQINTNEWRYPFSSADNSRYLSLNEPTTFNPFILDQKLSYAYPNPSNGETINFRLKLGVVNKIDIFIYDIAGYLTKKISRVQLDVNNDILEIPWNISNIESGIYIARIIVENEYKSDEKIIKLGIVK